MPVHHDSAPVTSAYSPIPTLHNVTQSIIQFPHCTLLFCTFTIYDNLKKLFRTMYLMHCSNTFLSCCISPTKSWNTESQLKADYKNTITLSTFWSSVGCDVRLGLFIDWPEFDWHLLLLTDLEFLPLPSWPTRFWLSLWSVLVATTMLSWAVFERSTGVWSSSSELLP